MPTPRTIVDIDTLARYTRWTDVIADQSFQSSGLLIEVLFRGGWSLSPDGVGRPSMTVSGLQAIIASPYFSGLAQHRISPPHWAGAKVVTKPGAPGSFNSDRDQYVVPDLINDLVDDDVFPHPDDEQIAYLVFMLKGFTQTIGANGAHTSDDDYEFPFDKDLLLGRGARWFDDIPVSKAARTFHERPRMTFEDLFSDPEGDGWFAHPASTGEIGDPMVLLSEINLKSNQLHPHDVAHGPIDSSYGRLRRAAGDQLRRTAAHPPYLAPLLRWPGV